MSCLSFETLLFRKLLPDSNTSHFLGRNPVFVLSERSADDPMEWEL